MATKNMDVRMSEKTMQQQRDIKAVDGVSISKARELILAKAVNKLHEKLFKPSEVLATLNTDENE